ncbi:carboxymuconolactone decarboxylase [Mycobacterium sp. ENV421]|uniref:carboxymuconolactone decarboxylase family protein n=1 Tax=Mycobacterium sp. ENV421 TaxID=1213407 RepID=UPI000C9AEB21|nr:carboxymuconolactone decarboxylase family protein [Mycobacterium sp. ENV421]PND54110.1 carboxymuconolactone decarboxylase [Mycobacterium sp. ENV421]
MLDREQAQLRAAECGLPEELADLSVFRVALHQPRVAVALHGLLEALLFRGSLDARLRELIIMRIGWITGSEYEWTQHLRIATLLGVSEHDLLAVRDWQNSEHLGPVERAVLAATDDVARDGVISGENWSACYDAFSGDSAVLVELVAVIANWRLFSILLRSLNIPLESGTDG